LGRQGRIGGALIAAVRNVIAHRRAASPATGDAQPGERLTALRRQGVRLAEEDGPVRRVPVPVIEHLDGGYDLITVFVRTHQVDAVLESLAGVQGDVLLLLNWAADLKTLGAVIGHERVLLGFPATGGTMDGDVVRYRDSFAVHRPSGRW
jgi:ketopantoate reductase